MGYMLDGEIVITGRAKDLILHDRRNIGRRILSGRPSRLKPLSRAMSRHLRLKAMMVTMTWSCWCSAG